MDWTVVPEIAPLISLCSTIITNSSSTRSTTASYSTTIICFFIDVVVLVNILTVVCISVILAVKLFEVWRCSVVGFFSTSGMRLIVRFCSAP